MKEQKTERIVLRAVQSELIHIANNTAQTLVSSRAESLKHAHENGMLTNKEINAGAKTFTESENRKADEKLSKTATGYKYLRTRCEQLQNIYSHIDEYGKPYNDIMHMKNDAEDLQSAAKVALIEQAKLQGLKFTDFFGMDQETLQSLKSKAYTEIEKSCDMGHTKKAVMNNAVASIDEVSESEIVITESKTVDIPNELYSVVNKVIYADKYLALNADIAISVFERVLIDGESIRECAENINVNRNTIDKVKNKLKAGLQNAYTDKSPKARKAVSEQKKQAVAIAIADEKAIAEIESAKLKAQIAKSKA